MNIQIAELIVQGLILVFVFLMWLRGNPQFMEARRRWRLFKSRKRWAKAWRRSGGIDE